MNRGASSELGRLSGRPPTVTMAADDRWSGWVEIQG
jgi:hypothetical protein